LSSRIQLIVGLANPGKEYDDTRHNAGAWFTEEIVNVAHATLRADPKCYGLHALISLYQQSCHILVPSTFMNRSGQSVSACMNYYKIEPSALLVAHDDIDLPAGEIRLKWDGGDGGHNGLKDIIRSLNTKQFYRLRIGVGHPGHRDAVSDYVLSRPSKSDKQSINEALQKAHTVLPLILNGEIQKAMQELHTV
jgi:PTH1 family peptidyl-tRNA hydrolase